MASELHGGLPTMTCVVEEFDRHDALVARRQETRQRILDDQRSAHDHLPGSRPVRIARAGYRHQAERAGEFRQIESNRGFPVRSGADRGPQGHRLEAVGLDWIQPPPQYVFAVAAGGLSMTLRGPPWVAAIIPLLPGAYWSLRVTVSDELY